MIEIAALSASLLLLGLSFFQVSLIMGAKLGYYAWGGKHKVLPPGLRVGSGISVLLYGFFVFTILNQSTVINLVPRSGWTNTALNVISIYFFGGIILNAASRSERERNIMTPLVTILALLFLYVALRS